MVIGSMPVGGGQLRYLHQIVTAKPFGLRPCELVGQRSQPRLILRLDNLPGAFPKFIDRQCIGIEGLSFTIPSPYFPVPIFSQGGA